MKKTLLLSALVVTATAFAGTTGKFTIDSKHTAKITKNAEDATSAQKKAKLLNELVKMSGHEIKGTGEVNLGESGITLGGDVKFVNGVKYVAEVKEKPANSGKYTLEFVEAGKAVVLEEANAFVKYGFATSVEGLDGYIKGNVKTDKFTDMANITITAEGQLSYKKDDMTYTLNSQTSKGFGDLKVVLDHEAKAEGKFDKVEDVLVLAKLHHGYPKHSDENKDVVNEAMYVLTEVKGTVKVMDGLKIGAQNKFDILLNGPTKDGGNYNDSNFSPIYDKAKIRIDKDFPITGNIYLHETNLQSKNNLAEMFKLYATYEKNNIEATGTGIVEYHTWNWGSLNATNKYDIDKSKELKYGINLDAKYKPIEKLTVGASALFAGITRFGSSYENKMFDDASKDPINKKNDLLVYALSADHTEGLVRLGVNTEYKAEVNDKLTVTPNAAVDFEIGRIKAADEDKKLSYVPSLSLVVTPKVSVEYKATDSVTLTASSKAEIYASRANAVLYKGDTNKNEFKYDETKLEAKLGLKYTW